MQGHVFHVTVLPDPPFIFNLEKDPQTGLYDAEGSFMDLFKLLAKMMNYTYTIEPPPDGAWGGMRPDGTWNGIIHLVSTNKKDFCNLS